LRFWIQREGFLISRREGSPASTINPPVNKAALCAFTETVSSSPEETIALGQRIASLLVPGTVLALQGSLGSGKTCLTKGIALGLGITDPITSPTYTIINEYDSPTPLYHIDAYRLNNEEEFEQIGGSELICGSGISIIEWSCRIKKILPDNTININIEITGPLSRLIKIDSLGLT